MNQEEIVSKIREAIKEDPKKDHIRSVALFGSILHGDFTDKSDVDLLVELRGRIGLLTLMAVQNRIEDKIGRPVQLVTKEDLSKYFRDEVIREAERIYQSDKTR